MQNRSLKQNSLKGFTLVELIVTVAIIGILSGIAIPAYTKFSQKGYRSTAQQFMLEVSSKEAQYLLDANGYTSTIGSGGLGLTAPTNLTDKYEFTVAVSAGPPQSFTVTATAKGGQSSDGDLTLDSSGNKSPSSKW